MGHCWSGKQRGLDQWQRIISFFPAFTQALSPRFPPGELLLPSAWSEPHAAFLLPPQARAHLGSRVQISMGLGSRLGLHWQGREKHLSASCFFLLSDRNIQLSVAWHSTASPQKLPELAAELCTPPELAVFQAWKDFINI